MAAALHTCRRVTNNRGQPGAGRQDPPDIYAIIKNSKVMANKTTAPEVKPVKYYEDQTSLQQLTAGLDKTKTIIQEIVTEWYKITDAPLTVKMIAEQFIIGEFRQPNSPEIIRALNMARVKKSPLYGEITDAALIDMLPPLADTSALIEAVRELGGYLQYPGYRDVFSAQCFTIEGRQVEFISEEVKRLAAPYSVTAETEGELQRLALATNVINALEEIRKHYPDITADSLIISGLVSAGLVDGHLFASPQFVQTAKVRGGGRRGIGFFNNQEAAAVFKKSQAQHILTGNVPEGGEAAAAQMIAERRNKQNN